MFVRLEKNKKHRKVLSRKKNGSPRHKSMNRLAANPKHKLNLSVCRYYFAISIGIATSVLSYSGESDLNFRILLAGTVIFFILGTHEFIKYRNVNNKVKSKLVFTIIKFIVFLKNIIILFLSAPGLN